MRPLARVLALAAVPFLALTACGDPETTSPTVPPATDPVVTEPNPDTPTDSGDATTVPPGALDLAAVRRQAASLLGLPEDVLSEDVRIARRGDEQFPLTADLVPGRLTVELDADEAGEFVVTAVSIETEDGSELMTVDRLLEGAAGILGTPEAGLDPAWRVGRRGDETFALTEDFVVGRFTVELDDDGSGAYVITAVTVEVPGGAETVTEETLLEDAAALIGTAEEDLPEDARIGRRGDELLPVTTDIRIGRFTYELDEDDSGVFRVVAVQVEFVDRVETVTAGS
jgi:hypothetical protein